MWFLPEDYSYGFHTQRRWNEPNNNEIDIYFLSPDLGQEGFRPAGPFVPPTFHHLKIEMENLGLQHRFLAKTRMHVH